MENYGLIILRASLGVVFLLFGIGKFQNDIWAQTIRGMSFFLKLPWNINISIFLIGMSEVEIGLALICGLFTRFFAALAALELLGILILLRFAEARDIGLLGMAVYLAMVRNNGFGFNHLGQGLSGKNMKMFFALGIFFTSVFISGICFAYRASAMLEPSGEIINGERVINVQASKYSFYPDPIVVKAGEKIHIVATAVDVAHGFGLSEFGVDARIEPGQENIIEFTAQKTGTFTVYCTVYCGPGHALMRGKFIVE